jgi:para-nitrobenzyl esterase
MQRYFVNFIKTGNPNGTGLPAWPATNRPPTGQVLRLDTASKAEPELHRERYQLLDQLAGN